MTAIVSPSVNEVPRVTVVSFGFPQQKATMIQGHKLRLTLAKPGTTKTPHAGICSCGWRSGPSHAAGIVNAMHDAHVTDAAATEDDDDERAA